MCFHENNYLKYFYIQNKIITISLGVALSHNNRNKLVLQQKQSPKQLARSIAPKTHWTSEKNSMACVRNVSIKSKIFNYYFCSILKQFGFLPFL